MSPPVLLLVGILLAAALVGEFAGAALLYRGSEDGQHLAAAREDLDSLVREQLADEIGVRGYVATRDRSFQEQAAPGLPFEARAAQLRRELAGLNVESATTHLDAFTAARRRWVSEVERPLLADPQRADTLAREKLGRSLLDTMRTAAKPLRDALDDADSAVSRRLNGRITAQVVAVIGIVTLVAVAALLLGFSRQEVVKALAREQSLVSALQQTLRVDGVALPRTAVGFAYSSATRAALVGGDLIDTWRADAQRGWFLIADVSGKGIQAARHSAFVQYAIRTLSAECDGPASVLARFNRLFLDTFDDPSIFVVAFLGAFDAASGSLRYASAGHSAAFIVRPGGIEQLAPTGSILGLDRAEVYTEGAVTLAAGDTVVLATDGLTESRDPAGNMLGDDGVIGLLAAGAAEPQALCDRLVREAERRSGGVIADDLAILVLRILAVEPSAVPAPFSTMSAP